MSSPRTIEQFIADIMAVESVDEGAMYDWCAPLRDQLRDEFYQSQWPSADFPIWLRRRFLAAQKEQPLPVPRLTPSGEKGANASLSKAPEPATGFVSWMLQLARRALL